MRFNPHFHALILEGGFDAAGRFIFIPLGDLARMTQYLRRRVLKLFLDKRLISRSFAENLLRWRHSGFSIDHSVRLHAHDQQARWTRCGICSTRGSEVVGGASVLLPPGRFRRAIMRLRTRYHAGCSGDLHPMAPSMAPRVGM